jgi:APA family basic amino acid/polyamine antiporter
MKDKEKTIDNKHLARKLGVWGLAATGICSMLGASINIVPFMIQRNVEGIGPYVLPAFLFAALPALLAAFAYSILSSAMPRAGGSYIYASRGLNPYLGFIASFSQWFGLSIVIGVIAYVIVPFIRDVFIELDWLETAALLEVGFIRILISLILIWSFVYVNIRGAKTYTNTLIPMMILMFGFGAIVIVAGFYFNHSDFHTALDLKGEKFEFIESIEFNWSTFLSASALLFSSFIGFDSIAQAGGEAKDPTRSLPRAIFIAIFSVGAFYFLFTLAVYHAVPWSYVAKEASTRDISAPGLLSLLLPPSLSIAILIGAAIALINDLPAMLLSVSRLMFAWAADGVFPKKISAIHNQFQTPYLALIISGIIASIGVLGSHFAGDFFLGIDIMVTSMIVNFLLMCITLVSIRQVNFRLFQNIQIITNRKIQLLIGWLGIIALVFFLIINIWKDLKSEVAEWYFHSTPVWIIVMALGTLIYFFNIRKLKAQGVDTDTLFKNLPAE